MRAPAVGDGAARLSGNWLRLGEWKLRPKPRLGAAGLWRRPAVVVAPHFFTYDHQYDDQKIVSPSCFSSALTAANRDVILYNGKIVTVDPKFSIAEAVVSAEKACSLRAPTMHFHDGAANTMMIDPHGRTLA